MDPPKGTQSTLTTSWEFHQPEKFDRLWVSQTCGCSDVSSSFATPWTVAHQVPLSVGSSHQEYWSGLPLPSPGDLPNTGIKPTPPVAPASAGKFFTTEPPGKPLLSQEKRLKVDTTSRQICHKLSHLPSSLLRAHSSFLKTMYSLKWPKSPNYFPIKMVWAVLV